MLFCCFIVYVTTFKRLLEIAKSEYSQDDYFIIKLSTFLQKNFFLIISIVFFYLVGNKIIVDSINSKIHNNTFIIMNTLLGFFLILFTPSIATLLKTSITQSKNKFIRSIVALLSIAINFIFISKFIEVGSDLSFTELLNRYVQIFNDSIIK